MKFSFSFIITFLTSALPVNAMVKLTFIVNNIAKICVVFYYHNVFNDEKSSDNTPSMFSTSFTY